MHIRQSASKPPIQTESYDERWNGPDRGTICCWLRGLEMRNQRPELAARALAGELPVLPWKGGVRTVLKTKQKIGAVQYLAAWQGLRGEDLEVDLDQEVQITCTRFGVTVTFTSSIEQMLAAEEELPPEES
jgi:hypothetical protein